MVRDVVWWVFAYGGFVFTGAVLLAGVRVAWRRKTLPTWLVVGLAATSMFWSETFADWGSYVLYDSALPQMPWGDMAFTAPSKPWGIMAGYCWFYLLWAFATRPLLRLAARRLPNTDDAWLALLVAVPAWYVWEIAIEFSMAAGGVWSYVQPFGPALHSSNGTFPLVWPLINQIPFMAFVTWIFYRRNARGLRPLDRFVPVATPFIDASPAVTPARSGTAPRSSSTSSNAATTAVANSTAQVQTQPHQWHPRYELARLLTWCVTFNLLFVGSIVVPQMLARVAFGDPSPLIP